MKKLLLIGIPVLAVVIALGVGYRYVFDTSTADTWYVQIDNESAQPQPSDADEYDYTLPAYDASGSSHQVTFGTERLLKDGAYLELKVMPLRGVISWAEVQPDGLPPQARTALAA